MNPLTEPNEAFHHELRRGQVWPDHTASAPRLDAHQARLDDHRPTRVLPERPCIACDGHGDIWTGWHPTPVTCGVCHGSGVAPNDGSVAS